jgi:DNA-binding CsgD family transcriptional regulator
VDRRLNGSVTGADWALVGRAEELEFLRSLRSGPSLASVFLSGPAGVGKSRLAREALAEAAGEGWGTLTVRGSAGYAAVPLGPFRTVFRLPRASGLTDLADSVAHELIELRSSKGLLLLVDDGQDLDETSAALVHQMAAAEQLAVIVTTRSGSDPPAAFTSLWKDGVARRIELQNLSRQETSELLVAGLGGSVQDSSANRLWHVTAGNPLYLREVVLSSAETGALRQIDGEWRWRGKWAAGVRLQEIVTARLGRLSPDELTAMELLAVAETLPLALVTGVSTVQAVQDLERRGLVITERSRRRLEVSIEHPLHAEVLRSRMPALQQRSIRRNLVDALTRTGAGRAEDRVRLACWSIEAGLEVDPTTLALGANASLFRIGQAISARLREIMPEAAPEFAEGPAVRQDLEMATRLAQAAYDRTGALPEGIGLASVLAWTGATGSAEAVLSGLRGRAATVDDRMRVALGLASVRFWGRHDAAEARATLVAVVAEADNGGDPRLLAEIFHDLAGMALNTGHPAEALAYSERSAAAQGVDLASSVAAAPAAAALVYLSRSGEAITLIDKALPAANEPGYRITVAQLLFARTAALARIGETEAARQLIEWLREVALSEGLLDAAAAFGVVLGEVLLRLGRPASASRIFRDSAGLLSEKDLLGYLPWALSGLARSRAMCGEERSASAALDEARRAQSMVRFFDASMYLAEFELHVLAGRSAAAVRAAQEGVAWARAAGMTGDEAQCLEALLRLKPSAEVAVRLAEIAASADSPLVDALAAQAHAVLAADPESLLVVSGRFAGMSAWWWAAQAASAATDILDRRGQARATAAAARTAAGLAEKCEGPRVPRPLASSEGPRLTNREREIAVLASAGHSCKEIGSRMSLSSRTVENHLHRVYVKLGVTNRATLAAALKPATPPE